MEKELVLQRVLKVYRESALTKVEFAELVGVSTTTIANYEKSQRFVSAECLFSLVGAFPELSAEWLLRGEGDMLLSPHTSLHTCTHAGTHTQIDNDVQEIEVEEIPLVPLSWVKKPDFDIVKNIRDKSNLDKLELVPVISDFYGEPFCHEMFSDALFPYIPRGTRMLLRPTRVDSIVNGEIYAIDVRQKGMFVRFVDYYDEGENSYFICKAVPERKDRYSDMKIMKKDVLSVCDVLEYRVKLKV